MAAGDGAARHIAAPREQWRAPLLCLREVGADYRLTLLLLFTDHARPRREHLLRDLSPTLRARSAAPRRWQGRSRGPRSLSSHVLRSRQRRAIIRRPPPRAAQHDRPAAGRRRGTCMFVCVYVYLDKGVRNASLAIYVLRHTSSPALAPAAHPSGFSDPSATPPREAARPVRQILPFHPPPRLASTAPCRPRIDGPTDARFAVPSTSVAATTGRGCVRYRTIRRQSIVIQFLKPGGYFLPACNARSNRSPKKSPQ